ncbi:hypothetical protein MG293_008156 [Ovis ammon polii]|uniref:Ig-like domain-containing protein n=1 Tax=Ovis ammon polii TaxID=230172 RepID=A0AAD4YAR4_OVIAM|nr:hypothetical protein MG293_008156 [Ovis ammon polii]
MTTTAVPKMTTTTTPVTTATTTSTITMITTVPMTTKASTSALPMATPTEDFQPVMNLPELRFQDFSTSCIIQMETILNLQRPLASWGGEEWASTAFTTYGIAPLWQAPAASQIVVRAFLGQPVTLPCTYPSWSPHSNSMCWGKGQCPNSKCNDELLYTDGTKVVSSKSPKYQLRGSIQRGDVSLTIINTNENDQSVYCCRIEVPGWFNDVKRNIRLDLRREPEPALLPGTSQRSIEATSHHSGALFTSKGKSDINQKHRSLSQPGEELNRIRMTSNYELLMIIAPSLGFVLLAFLLAFFLRGKFVKANCFQKHTRLDNAGEGKDVLGGTEDEDGLFTL